MRATTRGEIDRRTGIVVRWGVAVALVACAVACERPPVAWQPPVRTRGAPPTGWSLALADGDSARIATRPVAPFVSPPGACAASLAFASVAGGDWYAAWWQPRANGSAVLVVSRSTDGGTSWTAPVTADARDHSALGCARPAPAVAADSATGVVHVAYFLSAADGTGVWLVQSRDHGGSWQAPVAVLFGDDPARADVAARGDTVVVAYEYPNAAEARVGIAISYAGGRDIDARMPVSAETERAADPRVALRGGRVAVAWGARPPNGGDGDTTTTATVVDVGSLSGHP